MSKKRKKESCKTCKNNDHDDCYDPLCLQFIPVEKRPRVSTITCNMAGRLEYPEYAHVIVQAADWASQLAYRAMLFAQAHFTRLLEAGIEPEKFDSEFLTQVYRLIQDTGSKARETTCTEEQLKTYDIVFGKTPKIKTSGLSNINEYMKIELLTGIGNYDDESLDDHVAMYIRAKYNIKRGHGSSISGFVCRRKEPGQMKTLPDTLDDTLEYWNDVIIEEHMLYKDCCNEDGSFDSVRVMKYRYMMLKVIRDKALERNEEYRFFSLVPLRSEGRKFIQIDQFGLQTLKTLVRPKRRSRGDYNLSLHSCERVDDAFQSLDSFFNRKHTKGRGNEKWRLSSTIRTNGVELHILFETVNTKRLSSGKMKKLRLEEKIRLVDMDPTYVMKDVNMMIVGAHEVQAIDPGNATPYFAARLNPEGSTKKYKFTKISKKWYNKRSNRDRVKKRSERMMKKYQLNEIWELYGSLPIKGPEFAMVCLGVKERIFYHLDVHDSMSTTQSLRIKFTAKCKERKAMNEVLNILLEDGVKLLAFGDGSKLHGIRGTSCGVPNKRIKRLAIQRGKQEGFWVKDVDEHCTSCNSHCCHGHAMKKMLDGNKLITRSDGSTFRSSNHGLLICQGCNKVWSRDANGSINILSAAVNVLFNQERPDWLRKKIVRPAAHPSIAAMNVEQAL